MRHVPAKSPQPSVDRFLLDDDDVDNVVVVVGGGVFSVVAPRSSCPIANHPDSSTAVAICLVEVGDATLALVVHRQ